MSFLFSGLFTGHDPAREVGLEAFQKPPGRVGSGHEVFEISWVVLGSSVRRLSNISGRVG